MPFSPCRTSANLMLLGHTSSAPNWERMESSYPGLLTPAPSREQAESQQLSSPAEPGAAGMTANNRYKERSVYTDTKSL